MMSNGTKIGQYEIVSELGSGGMATVYKAFQRSLNRYVALKVLPDTLARDRAFVERFVREARIAASLKHPNIVTIYEISDTAPYFIAMEYIEGGSLATLIRQHGVMDPLRVATILRQVADALDVAHSRQVIHRDLKPSNIMLDERGRAILTDFGIARAMDATKLTQTGTVMGTPEYMAPEEIQGQPASARSDIYALGIVVYEMLTGRTPFRAETPLALMHQHVYNAPPSLRQFNPKLSSQIERVVNKAIAKKPNERFESAGSFASTFEAAVGAAKGSTSTNPTLVVPTLLSRRISPALLIAIPVVLLISIAVFVILLTRQNDTLPQSVTIPTPTAFEAQIKNTVAPLPSNVPTLFAIAATQAPPTFTATAIASATPTVTATTTPNDTATASMNETRVAQRVQETVAAKAAATAEVERFATAISGTQTAAAALTLAAIPTATPIPTQRPTFRPTAIPPTATPVPVPPTATPARSFFPLYLTSPDPGAFFGDENRPPLLQWQPATDVPLDENMFYRIQTSHNDAPACNIYTKRTIYQLPPSKQPGDGCDPNRWQFNTGDWVWRVSLVTRVDGDVSHDKEWANSEGRLFKWNK